MTDAVLPVEPAESAAPAACCRSCGDQPTRRGVLRGAAAVGVVGVGGAVLAACGSGGKKESGPVTVGKTADVPVGGGKVYRDQQVVVTQPTAGEYRAFSAVCTHQHCLVDGVSKGLIDCPCHGSMFHITDGSVAGGPAPSALPSLPVKVENGAFVVTFS